MGPLKSGVNATDIKQHDSHQGTDSNADAKYGEHQLRFSPALERAGFHGPLMT
jgi:hypothetical protein